MINKYNEKVSIIIPCYNAAQYVGRCINSILLQDYDNIEIIAVNDCSTDSTVASLQDIRRCLLDNYRGGKTLHIINLDSNKGVGIARDTGIAKSSGKYLMFVDPDDWIELNTVKECVKAMNRYNSDLVEFDYIRKTVYQEHSQITHFEEIETIDGGEQIEAKSDHI